MQVKFVLLHPLGESINIVGISVAPDIFQENVSEYFQGLYFIILYLDNILVFSN